MADIFSLIESLHGEITQQIRSKLQNDVELYFSLTRCCNRMDNSYQEFVQVVMRSQIEAIIPGRTTELVTQFISQRNDLDKLVNDMKRCQNEAHELLEMIKSEIITGAVQDDRCVYSFLCIADKFKESLCDLDEVRKKMINVCLNILPILEEIRKECESAEDV